MNAMLDDCRVIGAMQTRAKPRAVSAPECTVLDAGPQRICAADCARIVHAIAANEAAAVESGRNSTCFRIRLDVADGDEALHVAAKVPHFGPQRTNADTTFAHEAAILARLPEAGIADAPRLLARVAADGMHYLLTTWLAGAHPDPAERPLSDAHLAAIVSACTAMDRQGLMHYDLKATNLLLDGDAVRFVDFEFARFDGFLDAFAPARAAYCSDYNVSGNPHFPGRTNVANFEFRALYRYCEDLAAARSAAAGHAFFRRYLQLRVEHHEAMADFLAGLDVAMVRELAARGALDACDVECRLTDAVGHERMLAQLLREPEAATVEVEWDLLALRHDRFECPGVDVARRAREMCERLRRREARDACLPKAYLDAAARVAECVGRTGAQAGGTHFE